MGVAEASRIYPGETFRFPPEAGGAFYPTPKKQPCFFHEGDPIPGNGGAEEVYMWHRTRGTQDTRQRTLYGFYLIF